MKRLLKILTVVTLGLAMTGVAAADLVTNGVFETGDLTGWTFTRAASGSCF